MEPETPSSPINPWRSIWLRPRATVRWMTAHDPERHMLLLPGLAGIHDALARSMVDGAGDQMAWGGLLGIAVLLGPIVGIIAMLLFAWLLRVTGRWLGGQARMRPIITAYAWSRVPLVCMLPVWVVAIGLFGQPLFLSGGLTSIGTPLGGLGIGLFGLLLFASSVWTLVLLVMGLSEVQGFSGWRALGNIVLSGLVVVLGVMVIVFFLLLLIGGVPAPPSSA